VLPCRVGEVPLKGSGEHPQHGNQNEIDLVAVNDLKKTITIADTSS
jgi:hypothetical protein